MGRDRPTYAVRAPLTVAPTSRSLLSRLASAGIRGFRGGTAYLRAVMGADAYDRYRAHLTRHHPGARPLGEREFWREHLDWQDRHPQGRCC
ncbi:YbdD/YjiX family protein [Terrabacter sp. GCM10028922]|uniref:YbdD/YjiX family protein n=1 Tax=Terrabacter sp. GCM10028922 TaxID=3273428 RepID=UPI00360BD0D9